MQAAHFKDIRSKILPYLKSATKSLDIAMAWFTSAELFNALIACLHRNVVVRLVLLDSPINFMEYAPDFNEFIKAGGQLYIAKSNIGFMHHKFCVIDGSTVISGSYNWTYYAEARNVENIYITDDINTVTEYLTEHNRLTGQINHPSVESPRYTMLEVEAFEGLDFHEMNQEIGYICNVQNRPVKRVFETHTQVVISEMRLQPVAKETIGIKTMTNDQERLTPFIKEGEGLPAQKSMTFYFDSQTEFECPCQICRENTNPTDNVHLIIEEDILQIAKGTSEANLPILFSMQLDDNGSLRVDVSCAKSGERLTISTLDNELVKYV